MRLKKNRSRLALGGAALLSLVAIMSSSAQTSPTPPQFTSTDVVRLTVKVVDAKGRGLGGARVNVMRDTWGPDWRSWDYTEQADANGVARINVSMGAASRAEGSLYWPVLRVDATKGEVTASTQLKIVGKRLQSVMKYPAEVTHTVVLDQTGKEIRVAVTVVGEDGKPIEGAEVLIKDSSPRLGGDRGVTGADGKVDIPILFFETKNAVIVRKEGYEPGQGGVTVSRKDVGRTVPATITLKKGPASGLVEVTVETTNQTTGLPAADVAVTFTGVSGSAMGAYKGTTDANGRARLSIPGFGTFTVQLTQDTFEPKQDQVQIEYGEQKKAFKFVMTEKATGDESVTITVLAGDMKNGRGGFQPIKGATVTAGKVSGATDASGKITLDAKAGIVETTKGQGYVEAVNVKVSASGYKSQSRSVAIQRRGRNLEGTGSGTFILQPGEDPVSDETPLLLVVEVIDANQKPIAGAKVAFLLPDGTDLFGGKTDAAGKRDFSSDHAPDQPLATLRRGLKVRVTQTGYKDHESNVTADLLKPAKESHYSVQLDKDWSELEKAIDELERQVNLWRAEPQSVAKDIRKARELGEKVATARVSAERSLSELKAALKGFDAQSFADRCKEATQMARAIDALQVEAKQKDERLLAALKEATELAARCRTTAESETILTRHKEAIKLIGEVGVLGRKAMEINGKLTGLVEPENDAGTQPKQLREHADKIEEGFKAAEKDAATAGDLFRAAVATAKSLRGRQARFRAALDDLRTKYKMKENRALIPAAIWKRVGNIEDVLASVENDVSFGDSPNAKWLDVVKDDVRRIQQAKIAAAELLSGIKDGLCEVKPRKEAVEEIRTRVSNAGFELGLAADLPARAQACAAAAVAAASPSLESEDVTVPDLSVFNGLTEMQAAARHAGLVPTLAATKGTAPAGSQRLFAGQNPAPNTKVKKGSTVTILVFQKATETAAATAAPTPAVKSDDVTVPDLSVFDGLTEMQAATTHAGLVPALAATKGTPPPGSTRLFAGQNPAAGTKAKRGSVLQILVYQQAIASDEVTVPDLSVFDGLNEMRAAASHVGLVPALAATRGTPPPGSTRLFAGQDPAPGAKAKRGSTLKILVYQKRADTAASSPSATESPSSEVAGTMPNLIGLTLEQAVARLPANMQILGDEVGDPPPSEEKAYTIFSQSPPANSKVSASGSVRVTVKRYGSTRVAAASPTPATDSSSEGGNFAGTWQGNLTSLAGSTPVVLEVRPSGTGYSVLWYSPNDRKSAAEYPARVENGRLVLEFDLDLALTVGMFGESASEQGGKHIFKFRYTFSLSGDTMSAEVWVKDTKKGEEGTRPSAGLMKRK